MISTALRRLFPFATLVVLLGAASVAAAGPAAAEPAEGWWPVADPVSAWHAVLVLGGIPLLVFVVIGLLVYAPSLARGEGFSTAPQEPESQWLGGPRKSAGELAAPDGEDSQAGGAGGNW